MKPLATSERIRRQTSMNKRSMNTNLDSKLGQGTSERGRSQVETHLSTVIFNDRFTARILGYSSNFLKSVEKNSRERVRFIPIRPLVERIPMVSRNSKKKGGTVVEICQKAKSCQDQSPTDNFLPDIRRILIARQPRRRTFGFRDREKKLSPFFITRFVKTNRVFLLFS